MNDLASAIYRRPELAKRYLDRLLNSPNRALSIFGPRQTGKTTLLQNDLVELAQHAGLTPLYVDFMATTNSLELLNSRLAQLVQGAKMALSKRRVKSASVAGFGVGLEEYPTDPSSTDHGVQLQNHFAALNRLKPGVRIVLMLDEAQELTKLKDGEATMKSVRALFNTFQGQLLLLITGSSREGLLRLFGDRHRASFGLADHEDFQRLGRDFVEAKSQAFNKQRRKPIDIDLLNEAFQAMEHRPADFIGFLEFLAVNDIRDVPASVQVFLKSRYPQSVVTDRFEAYTPLQQALLRLMAAGVVQLTAKTTLDKVGAAIGGTISASGIRNALTTLPPDVVTNPGRGIYDIVDVQLLAWLKESALLGSE